MVQLASLIDIDIMPSSRYVTYWGVVLSSYLKLNDFFVRF
jgi:hypothetical protein